MAGLLLITGGGRPGWDQDTLQSGAPGLLCTCQNPLGVNLCAVCVRACAFFRPEKYINKNKSSFRTVDTLSRLVDTLSTGPHPSPPPPPRRVVGVGGAGFGWVLLSFHLGWGIEVMQAALFRSSLSKSLGEEGCY